MSRVIVCDLGIGNLRSVVRAVSLCGGVAEVTADPSTLESAHAVIVPGQGAFRDGAAALGRGFGEALRRHIEKGRPYLGICLGLQLLFDRSDESPGSRGLGVLRGNVVRIPTNAAPGERPTLKLPHIGWNDVLPPTDPSTASTPSAELAALFGKQVYFAHSFVAEPEDRACIAAVVDYGGPLVCAVARENVLAVQFHPEKSQGVGLAFIAAWVAGIDANGARP